MTGQLISRMWATLKTASVLDCYTMLCGVFLVLAPWLFGFIRAEGRIDAEVAGVVLVTLSAAGFLAFADWRGWLKVAVGAWLIAAPWLLGFVDTSAMHVSIAIGIVITFLTLLEIWVAQDSRFASSAPPKP
jgi:SPW repeat-containing protein